jgi:uncharacterized protein (DUF433 family)
VAKTKKKPVPKQNPVEVPLYTPWDVARYLRLPLGAADTLTGRFRGWPEPDYLFRYLWRYPHQLSLVDDDFAFPPGSPDDRYRISFRRFADLFVRAGVLHALAEWSQTRVRHRQAGEASETRRWESLHRTIWRGLEDTSREPVPFDASPAGERADRLAEPFARGLDGNLAALLKKQLATRLDRVETERNVPVRLYPPTREPADASPRMVVLDPKIRFGRPTVAGRGVPTDSLFERYQAGDAVTDLADDYGLTPGEVDEAIRYESRPPLPFSGW